jgi:hypothetical protein
MVRFLSSVLIIFFLILPYAVQLDLSCPNNKREQFFELFESQLPALSSIRHAPSFYSRPLLVPSSQETDEINATTDQCGPTLIDIEPFPTYDPVLNIDVNITDNQNENVTIPVSSNISDNAPSESEPPIKSFEEWTKQKLEQEKLKHHSVTNGNQNVDHLTPPIDKAAAASTIETVSIEEKIQTSRVVHSIPLVVSKRNYASKECGAKVIGANDEAEKSGAILNDKEKDEYMRNACEKAKEKFVIIELCETIQPKSIELANYELFSSSPKSFRILGSERQPPVWITLGEFEAADNREVQTFQIPEHNIYTKSIRLELLTHHGKEHYCTLSSFRVYGISMVDEYEAEATAAFGVTENAGAPMKITETLSNNLPTEEPLVIAPSISPEVTEPPLQTTLEIPPLDVIEPVVPLAPWQIRDCLKCENNHPKAVTAWLCYVFSPSMCSKRKIFAWKNGTVILSKSQTKFLKAILQPRSLCPLYNTSVEKKAEEKPIASTTTVLPTKQENVITHTLETEVKKQTIVQHKQASNVPLPAGTTSHKESVFLKLNKRLSNLELNISLSSQYLAELSKQYVFHTEENRKNHEKTSKYIEEAISRASNTLSKQFGDEILKIQKEIKDLFAHFHAHPSASNVPGPFEKGHSSGSLIIRFPVKEHCSSSEYDNIYLDESDGLWTTQQLVVVIAVMQATTFGMMFVLQYLWKNNASQKVVIISSDIDVKKIIAAEVQNELKEQHQKMQQHLMMTNTTTALILPNTSASSSEHPTASTPFPPNTATSTIPSKKRRKKKRNTNSGNNFSIPSSDKWDSTSVSSNISGPSTSVCSSTLTSISSLLKKKNSTASRDSCFTSESTENVPSSEQHLFPPYLTH